MVYILKIFNDFRLTKYINRMEYQKIISLIDNKTSLPSKLITKIWVEFNNDVSETYSTNSQIRFKIATLMASLCDYSDACILVNGFITFVRQRQDAAAIIPDRNNK